METDSSAGYAVAVTEAEEDASFVRSSVNGRHTMDGMSVVEVEAAGGNDESANVAPGHFHALRSPALLKGSSRDIRKVDDANEARSRSTSRSRPGSRRGSDPSPPDHEELLGRNSSPSISVSSSLDRGDHEATIDLDILLDKLGFRDLDPDVTQEKLQEMLRKHISANGNSLPTLNERLTEDTMEDSHAFQDLVISKCKKEKNSREGAMNDARKGLSTRAIMELEHLLNTLEEGDDEDEDAEGKEPPENDSEKIEVEKHNNGSGCR